MTCEGILPVLSALGGGLVSGAFLLAGARLNQKRENRERLRSERRLECVRLVAAAEWRVRDATAEEALRTLGEAEDTLLFLGPEHLAQAAATLASAARRESAQGLPSKYLEARTAFYRAAKQVLRYYDL